MIIGIPKELKSHESRVSLTPSGAKKLVAAGHRLLVEKGAGLASGFRDSDYNHAGAEIARSRRQLFASSEMILKVKEPVPDEYDLLKEGQIVFTFFHFAASRSLTLAMIRKKIVAIPYETIQIDDGTLPLLRPMSEIAGKLSVQEGARYLERPHKGSGILLGGATGVAPARVTVLGGGVAGSSAAASAAALGANVTVLDIDAAKLKHLRKTIHPKVTCLPSSRKTISSAVPETDLLIGAVLSAGRRAPVLVNKDLVMRMRPGSVIVDIAVDQGGCIDTARPTTYQNPTYLRYGVLHFCVANLPGAVPRTSTPALTGATLPYVKELADKGYAAAVRESTAISRAVTLVAGAVVRRDLARHFRLTYTPLNEVLP